VITRRAALLAGASFVLAGCSGGLPPGVPDVATGRLAGGSFRSRYRRTDVGWSVSYPPGRTGALPVLVFLHGRGGDHSGAFGGSLHLDKFLADAVGHGTKPFAIASVDGGDHEYWHPRRDSDPAAMVIHEFLPLLARNGLDVRRIGLMGNSMGGYGALYLASVLRRDRVSVAVAESPAIWRSAAQTVEGAFDDAADFAAHSIFGRLHRLAGIALRVDCGGSDGFAPITRELRAMLHPTPAGGIEPGGHDATYWRSQAPAQLRFAGRHL
jgi:enterochelin esterase-like enzyme